jgi:hypothetical protein
MYRKAKLKMGGKGWLRIEDLHPLDVALSRSPHFQSKLSARLSGGGFSHAALVLDEHFWFDAQPKGCGMYSPGICAIQGDDGWYLDLRTFGTVSILRHPIIGLMSDQRRAELRAAAMEYCNNLNGTNYAQYKMLLPLVRTLVSKSAKPSCRGDRSGGRISALGSITRGGSVCPGYPMQILPA